MTYKESMAKARMVMLKHVHVAPPGKLFKFSDVVRVLADDDVILSASGLSELVARLVDEGKLIRASTKRMFVPLRTNPRAITPRKIDSMVVLTDTQRIILLEEQVTAMNEQLMALQSRLL